MLGRDDVAPLRLNPLAPPPGVRRETHAGSLLASFKAALPLVAPQPQLLEQAIASTRDPLGFLRIVGL